MKTIKKSRKAAFYGFGTQSSNWPSTEHAPNYLTKYSPTFLHTIEWNGLHKLLKDFRLFVIGGRMIEHPIGASENLSFVCVWISSSIKIFLPLSKCWFRTHNRNFHRVAN